MDGPHQNLMGLPVIHPVLMYEDAKLKKKHLSVREQTDLWDFACIFGNNLECIDSWNVRSIFWKSHSLVAALTMCSSSGLTHLETNQESENKKPSILDHQFGCHLFGKWAAIFFKKKKEYFASAVWLRSVWQVSCNFLKICL